MKIFLPFTVQSIGGTSTFAAKFKEGIERRGHQVSFEFSEDYDILFLIAQGPFEYLLHAKKNNKPIVQRLDGVYYWSVASWKFPFFNAKAAYIRHFFTDFTVYQSEYSQYCVNRFLGREANEKSTTIYNGVDLNLFKPSGPRQELRDNPTQKIFFTASAFRRADQIIPIIEAVGIYRKKYNNNCQLVIAGNFKGKVANVPDQYRHFPYLRFLGRVNNPDLPAYERAADIFLHTHLNPPCPNNVIEAMACGLPICGVADGGMPELVQEGRNGLLVPAVGDAFWRRRSIDVVAFADNMQKILERRNKYSQMSRRIAEEYFSLDSMIADYANVFERSLQ